MLLYAIPNFVTKDGISGLSVKLSPEMIDKILVVVKATEKVVPPESTSTTTFNNVADKLVNIYTYLAQASTMVFKDTGISLTLTQSLQWQECSSW